jgi:hypothetical protein
MYTIHANPLSVYFCTEQCMKHVPQHLTIDKLRKPLMAPLQGKLHVIMQVLTGQSLVEQEQET